jgi:CRP/FNR family cyclic AMP-dependent transcriptional regulator
MTSLTTLTPALSKLEYLSMVELFWDLSPDEIEQLERATRMVTYRRGRVLYSPDEPAEVLFILKQGEVEISRITLEGKKLVLARLGPGSIFGEMAVLGQRMHRNFAEALTDCLVCVMSRSDVEELLLGDPRITRRLVHMLGSRLAEVEDRLEELAFKGISARLASLLLRLASDTDWRGRRVLHGLTHQQLAELLGTYRETVTATLNQFRDQGLVEIGRRRVTLLDPARLEAIAAG